MSFEAQKTIYFVRHGESVANEQGIRQGSDDQLNDKGKKQAQLIGRRLKALPLEVVVASVNPRATETAKIATALGGQPLEPSPLFAERRNSSSIIGKPFYDPEVMATYKTIREHEDDPEWHYEDEENFHDLRERATTALNFLLERPEAHIGVVTHALFMSVMLAVITFGPEVTPAIWHNMRRTFHFDNTGLTVAQYGARPESGLAPHWRLLSWNDLAHLGE